MAAARKRASVSMGAGDRISITVTNSLLATSRTSILGTHISMRGSTSGAASVGAMATLLILT